VQGTCAATEQGDSAVIPGSVLVAGLLSAVEGGVDDTASMAGQIIVTGALGATDQPDLSAILGFVSAGGGGASVAEIWGYVLPNGLSAEQTLADIHRYLLDLSRIHGLIASSPLTVSATQRAAGGVVQSITDEGGVVTVQRQP
jgi:hypothetical protein